MANIYDPVPQVQQEPQVRKPPLPGAPPAPVPGTENLSTTMTTQAPPPEMNWAGGSKDFDESAPPPATLQPRGGIDVSQPPGLIPPAPQPPVVHQLNQDGTPGAEMPKPEGVPPGGGEWVPNQAGTAWTSSNNPTAWKPPAGAAPPVPGAPAPGAPAPGPVPGSPEDIYRKTLLGQMQGSEDVSINDPALKAQLDPFAAAMERTRRSAEDEAAERSAASGGAGGGAEQLERRMAQERAGQATGLKAADLVGSELATRRQRIDQAIARFGDRLTEDQRQALEKEKMSLDAALRREQLALQDKLGVGDLDVRRAGIEQQGRLGSRELDIREMLGKGGLGLDWARLRQGGEQFDKDLGFRAGSKEADLNLAALRAAMGL